VDQGAVQNFHTAFRRGATLFRASGLLGLAGAHPVACQRALERGRNRQIGPTRAPWEGSRPIWAGRAVALGTGPPWVTSCNSDANPFRLSGARSFRTADPRAAYRERTSPRPLACGTPFRRIAPLYQVLDAKRPGKQTTPC